MSHNYGEWEKGVASKSQRMCMGDTPGTVGLLTYSLLGF